jgi:hypothetical protein
MYIPLTYWESQADTLAQTNAKFCVFGALSTVPQTISYNYETSPFSYTFTQKEGITNICQDTTDQSVFYRPLSLPPGVSGLMMLTSQPYFCSATITSSAGIPSTCCVQTPPNTGPEAWYIDIKYVGAFDNGTFYFYYINQYGDLVNDTITFAQNTKRIVSQTAAFWIKNPGVGYPDFLNWNLISKFPGQVIPYKYKDLPAKYILTLKRLDPGGLGQANFNNYWYQTTGSLGLSGSLVSRGSASVGTKLEINSYNLPLANSAIYYNAPNGEIAVYPTSSLQYNIQNCNTSITTSVDLQSNVSYSAGTVIKVNDPSLTGCWTILGFASRSLGIADYYTTINSTYINCDTCIATSTTTTTTTLAPPTTYNTCSCLLYEFSSSNNPATAINIMNCGSGTSGSINLAPLTFIQLCVVSQSAAYFGLEGGGEIRFIGTCTTGSCS